MSPTKTSQGVPDFSAPNSRQKQRSINQGSTPNTSEGFGVSAAPMPQSGARAKTHTDQRYASKKIPTVRYHPDITEKRPEGHQESNTPEKNIQVRGKPVVSPRRPTQVRYHPDITGKRPEGHQQSNTPEKDIQVRGKPVVSPQRPTQVKEGSMVSPPRPTQVKEGSMVSPPRPTQVKEGSMVSPPRPTQVKQSTVASPPRSSPAKESSEVSLPSPGALTLGFGQKIDKVVVEAVELQTRGQRENPNWFAWRQNRITASVAHRLAHSRFVNGNSQTPPKSYLEAITGRGPNIRTRAMTWGIENEAEAVQRYQVLKSKALGRMLRVQECGLFIDPQRPWLAGSPDGIVEDPRTGERLLCLEVKCPYKHRLNTVSQACREDQAFCLITQGQEEGGQVKYLLKPDHSYYTQIQCQLAVTGLTQADLVVFTLKETAIVPVTFDPCFWNDTLVKLERFYTGAVLPYIRDTGLDAAAMLPEE
uniref:YqaJ viral recombinase domain-containing protein n=1 Tax=Esox lucius TaxID=8010 RepID=A0A3P8XJW5_ESOLU